MELKGSIGFSSIIIGVSEGMILFSVYDKFSLELESFKLEYFANIMKVLSCL